MDAEKWRPAAAEFGRLGLGEPLMTSALQGNGVGDLLDEIVKRLKKITSPNPLLLKEGSSGHPPLAKGRSEEGSYEEIKVAIIGKPNVGKSTLINTLIGEKKFIVSGTPHTTREPNDVLLASEGEIFRLVDTAGIRRQAKVGSPLEKGGVSLSLKSLKKSDICLLVLDISQTLSRQDKILIDEIVSSGKGLLMLGNKWDKVEDKDTTSAQKFTRNVRASFPHARWAPIMFASGLKGSGVKQILPTLKKIYQAQKEILETDELAAFLKKTVNAQPPPRLGARKKRPDLLELAQKGRASPTFELVYRSQGVMPITYLRFLENQLRQHYKFFGNPVKVMAHKLK